MSIQFYMIKYMWIVFTDKAAAVSSIWQIPLETDPNCVEWVLKNSFSVPAFPVSESGRHVCLSPFL
jgi:hypothetical protein